MTQVLVYGNRKQPDMQFVFADQAEKEKAFLELFNYLREEWKVYECGDMSPAQSNFYTRALNGDGDSAIRLLTARKTYEYEVWHIENVPTKEEGRVSTKVVLKPDPTQFKSIEVRHEGSLITINVVTKKDHKYEFVVVPTMTTFKDWEDLNAIQFFIRENLDSAFKTSNHNKKGLEEALSLINELRHGLHYATNPETAPPFVTIATFFRRIGERAEAFIKEWSNTPLENLVTKKRRPSTLEECQDELAASRRTVDALEYALRKAGKTEVADDIMRAAKREKK